MAAVLILRPPPPITHANPERRLWIGLRTGKKEETAVALQYKVLTQKDRFMSGKFAPEVLERALNGYAAEGWRVVASATADFPGGLGSSRQELVLVLERET